jgi:colanic acid/amylovoran biosynthesis glycosyltransferase
VYPSYYPEEGQPLVLLEALAAGLPIVSTRHAGIPDTVRDGLDGILVEPRDTGSLATTLERLASDPEERSRLGSAARQRYEQRYRPERLACDIRHLLGVSAVEHSPEAAEVT